MHVSRNDILVKVNENKNVFKNANIAFRYVKQKSLHWRRWEILSGRWIIQEEKRAVLPLVKDWEHCSRKKMKFNADC